MLLHRRARLAKDARKTRRAPARARRQGRRYRPHPRADRTSHRRGFAIRDRGRYHGRDPRAVSSAPEKKRRSGMKFGPASPADAIGGVTVHTLRQGALVLKKGTTI